MNIIITGRPGHGKTTLIKRIKDYLTEKGATVGGIFTPEVRKGKKRIGFKIVDIMTGREGMLAVKGGPGPKVGSYGVNIDVIRNVGISAIEDAIKKADYILIDEVAPMELKDPNFAPKVDEALSSDKMVIAAFHRRIVQNIKDRDDIKLFTINPQNRDKIYEKIRKLIGGGHV